MAEKSKNVYANDVFVGREKPVRVLFNPHLAEPVRVGGKGDPKFEIQIGFPKDHPDYITLLREMRRIAQERWPDRNVRATADKRLVYTDASGAEKELSLKLLDGDREYDLTKNHPDESKRREYPHLQGQAVMKLRSKLPIAVFDVRERDAKGNPVQLNDGEKIRRTIYSGSYVALKLTLSTYDEIIDRDPSKSRAPGVTAFPEQVCFVADGERLSSGGKDDGSGFSAVQGFASSEDPTGGEDPLAGF